MNLWILVGMPLAAGLGAAAGVFYALWKTEQLLDKRLELAKKELRAMHE